MNNLQKNLKTTEKIPEIIRLVGTFLESRGMAKLRYRMENRKWLSYAGRIALRVIASMEDNPSVTKEVLAERTGLSTQEISLIIKGQLNLSLDIIAKLSGALQIELISFPDFKYNRP